MADKPVQSGFTIDGDAMGLEDVAAANASPWIAELGTTGLKRAAGYVDEEFLPQLRGRKAVQIYREMADNDPIVGAMLFSISQLIRQTSFTVIPGGKSKQDSAAAHLLETCMEDMSHTWGEFVQEAMTGLTYGWSFHEIVYKRRGGPWAKDGRHRSKYSDGLIGWRRLPIRSQETLQKWIFDESGGIRGMEQLAPPDYQLRILPIERGLLFRYGVHKNNPEGKSILRNAYRPWFYKKRLEEFESIGVERDLAGLPMVTVPADYLKARKGTEQYKMVEAMRKLARGVRRNEQEGIVFPAAYDPDTKQPLFKFELMSSGGARQFSTNELIQRYEQRILMTTLSDFILVGHSSTGTYNLHVDKTGIFKQALNAIAQDFANTLNRYAIPRLMQINGFTLEEMPTIKPDNVDSPDLGQLASFLNSTAGLGFTWGPDADMERFLRSAAGLPEMSDDDYVMKEKIARQSEAVRMAQSQTEYLASQQQLKASTEQAEMAEEGMVPRGQTAADAMATQQAQGGAQPGGGEGAAGKQPETGGPNQPSGNPAQGEPVAGQAQR